MRKIALLSLLTLVAVSLAAAGTVGASRHVARAGGFSYCDNPTFPPMENTTKAGKPVGFDIDFANALGAQRCDVVISGVFITPDRTKQFPAIPYMKTHRALIVAAGNPKKITSPSGLAGTSVAVQAGTKYQVYLQALQKKEKFTLHGYPGDSDAIGQLLIGRADAVLSQDTEAAYSEAQHPGKITIGYLFPAPDTFGIYYRKGDAIGARIAAAIKTMKANGTLDKLAAKYKIPAGDVK